MQFAALVLGLLVFGSQVVLSEKKFTFSFSKVEQCEPVSIIFTGDADVNALPRSLLLLPFNSPPISIPMPDTATNSSTVSVSFFPLAADTRFIASLDDATGDNSAKVSDVTRVHPSPTGNTACLPAPVDNNTQPAFQLSGELRQCEAFTVNYNRTRVASAPSIRVLNPRGFSVPLNLTTDDPANGSASYTFPFPRGKEVVLMFDNGQGVQETGDLLTVGGDSSSDTTCLTKAFGKNGSASDSATGPALRLSRDVLIGLAIGGGFIVVAGICLVVFLMRRRRRRRKKQIIFDPALLEKNQEPPSTMPPSIHGSFESFQPLMRESFIQDPPYTKADFDKSSVRPTSTSSWSQLLASEPEKIDEGRGLQPWPSFRARVSISSLDIEGMLDMATIHSDRSSQVLDPDGLASLQPLPAAIPRPYPGRNHLEAPSDVPMDPNSMLSYGSANPFSDEYMIPPPAGPRPMSTRRGNNQGFQVPIQPLRPVLRGMGLPSNPRRVPTLPGRDEPIPSPLRAGSNNETSNTTVVGIAR